MRKIRKFILVSCLASCWCYTGCIGTQAALKSPPASLNGAWCLVGFDINTWISSDETGIIYPELVFVRDSIGQFKPIGDMVFNLFFTLDRERKILHTKDWDGKEEEIKIVKLTSDSLVVNGLWDMKGVRKYTRCKRE